MKTFDILVIGAGPGGTPAAMAAAQFGKSVLLVEKSGLPGGDCLFEGCIPSKVLENAANRFAMFKEMAAFHIDTEGMEQIHWDAVIADKEALLQRRSQAALKALEGLKTLTFMKGEARFVDAHTVEIDRERFGFEKAVIASGASAHLPPFKGDGVAQAWTHADVFKEKTLPESIVFIGAGAISCELVQMFNKLGVRCHILERGERILRRVDATVALEMQSRLVEDGVKITLAASIEQVDKVGGEFHVTYSIDGEKRTVETPHLLIAAGLQANVEGMGLKAAGVQYSSHGIETDQTLQTSQPHIYAVGDCTVGPKFAHWASYEAGIAVHNLFSGGPKHTIDAGKLAWVLFSDPQIALAGLSEAEARAAGMDVSVERYDYRIDARAQIDKSPLGMLQFVIDKNGVIVGIQILSEEASSLVGEAALIVANKMTFLQVLSAIHPHPTLSEAFGHIAQARFFKMMKGDG